MKRDRCQVKNLTCISFLYSNTEFKILERTDPYLKSNTNLAMKEISILLGESTDAFDTTYIKALSDFCEKNCINCESLYISSRASQRNEVIYRLKHMHENNIDIEIIIENYENHLKAGIINEFRKEN